MGVVLVLLPGGTFWMGAERARADGASDDVPIDPSAGPLEGPAHAVTLAPFFVSKYEVTQEQWLRWTGRNPSRYPPSNKSPVGPNHPVESVSWTDAIACFHRLGLDLPTEAQWEYAARGGTRTRFWTGDTDASVAGAANGKDLSISRLVGPDLAIFERNLDDGHPVHAPVDALHPNPFGLHGIIGNVQEWCLDPSGLYRDPWRPRDGYRETPADGYRSIRGGSYLQMLHDARSSARGKLQETLADFTIGLRPVRGLDP
jgi:formylglycine-generating enzyme required for sulfatase activity